MDIPLRDMPGQFPRRTRVGVRTEVPLGVGDCRQNFLGNCNFSGKAIEHHGTIAQDKLGRGSGHTVSLFGWGLMEDSYDRLRSGATETIVHGKKKRKRLLIGS